MFRHKGKSRTYKHNIQIASLLSFVAGIVNVVGFLSVFRLTTNVTGHFTYFINGILKQNFHMEYVYFIFIFAFFFGSFLSNFLVEYMSQKSERNIYVIPMLLEVMVLFLISIFGKYYLHTNPDLIAYCLLFAMGLQNSLVTSISNAAVRTTHLTGLFTDLGIEISQLFFYKKVEQRKKLMRSIKLRFIIITFFFIGALIGGVLYEKMELYVLSFAAATLLLGLIYDNIKLKLILLKRKFAN
ncbi:MAG: YoaK family protein [Flavobacterium sp.]